MSFLKKKVHSKNSSRGFTLIELMVSIFIITTISGVIIFQYARFDGQLLLKNLAFEVALSVRDAQQRGITAQDTKVGANTYAYGVHFSHAAPTQYIIFRDANDDLTYDAGEAVNTFTMTRGNSIKPLPSPLSAGKGGLCAGDRDSGGAFATNECWISTLDIMFVRPNPDAFFARTGTLPSPVGTVSEVEITLINARNTIERTVRITNTGQVSVP
jgi:prepilin-type N-terminal cleavage/methylation domain-containing protein